MRGRSVGAVPGGKAVKAKGLRFLWGAAALSVLSGPAVAQAPPAAVPSPAPAQGGGLQTGPATVAPHWSRYKYPDSIPAGAQYHIIEKGDTLWDLSAKYLQNPFLWPQIWDQNRYIKDAHWIYPGDPLILPNIALISGQPGQPGAGTEEGARGEGGVGLPEGGAENVLRPVTEEETIRCAHYVLSDKEDESLVVIGSEQGNGKIGLTRNDVIYLNKGASAGLKTGDEVAFRHEAYVVKHPRSQKPIGTKIETTGFGRVILVEDNVSSVMIEGTCQDIHVGDYVTPVEKPSVPLIVPKLPATRLTPPSGKAHGFIVDIAADQSIAAAGHIVSIDLGSNDGMAPGGILVVYRTVYPSVPTPRNVVGEVTVLTVRDKTSTAKVTYSNDAVMDGDEVELR
jgi:hypothetical protein